MDPLSTIANVGEIISSQFTIDNAPRLTTLCVFKVVEKIGLTLPYVNTNLKPIPNLLLMEMVFLLNDHSFALYDKLFRDYLDTLKPGYD